MITLFVKHSVMEHRGFSSGPKTCDLDPPLKLGPVTARVWLFNRAVRATLTGMP